MVDINECDLYGYNGKTTNIVSCTSPAANQRTVTCKAGFRAVTPDIASVVLTGNAAFLGCTGKEKITTGNLV